MKINLAAAFVIVLAICSGASANDYLWPLKLTPELTSKFCDYRAGHFHGGLDIRTQGRIGIPVYAVSDAYIFRVTTSFRGYGKALYLKLRGGRLVVYGHLSAFAPAVEERIFRAQISDKKYNQDLYFTAGEFPIKKGELVAYSGSTGTGAPHLHFEMRSPSNNPLNPLETGFSLPDYSAPRFDELVIRYYDRAYNGEFNPANPCVIEFAPVVKTSMPNEYIIKDTLVSDGYLALAVSGGDLFGGPGFLYGFFGLKLLVDDSLIFQMQSDSLSFNTTRQLTYVRDLELIRLTSGRKKTDNDRNIFYRLYVPPRASQYFWDGFADGSGVIHPGWAPGTVRKAEVVAYDEFGNSSRLEFYVKTPDISLPQSATPHYIRKGDSLIVDFASLSRLSGAAVEHRQDTIQQFRRARVNFISDEKSAGDGFFHYILSFSIPSDKREFRFAFHDTGGRISPWYHFDETTDRNLVWLNGTPDYLNLYYAGSAVSAGSLSLEIENIHGQFNIPMVEAGPGIFRADLVGNRLSGTCRFTILDGVMAIADTQMVLYAVAPDIACEVESPDSTMTITFPRGSSYYPDYIFSSVGKISRKGGGNIVIYEIQPANFLADRQLKFEFDVGRLGLVGRRVGAYGASDSGEWNFIGKSDGSKLEVAGLGLGEIALLEDNEPPVISSVSPSAATAGRTPLLKCHINDVLSGLDLDGGLSMSIDGGWVPAEYDIDSGNFNYKVKNALKIGKHRLEIGASDNQGNAAEKVIIFTVIAKK